MIKVNHRITGNTGKEANEIVFAVSFEGVGGNVGHYLTPNSKTVVNIEEHFEC